MTAPQGKLVHQPCPLCGEDEGKVLYRHRGQIVLCNCGLVRRDPIPRADDLLEIYRSPEYFKLQSAGKVGYGDYFADEQVYRPYFRATFRTLERFTRPPGRLLEIGAAAGFALDEARRRGWSVTGLELSPRAVTFAQRTLGLDVRLGGIMDVQDQGGPWDVIAAFQTIEHFPDVVGALRTIRAALATGGYLVLTSPDHGSIVRQLMRRFWISYRPEHLVYFDRATLPRLLRQEGFACLHVVADRPLVVPIRRLAERAAHYYAQGRFELPFVPPIKVPVWLGDMLIIAQRNLITPRAHRQKHTVAKFRSQKSHKDLDRLHRTEPDPTVIVMAPYDGTLTDDRAVKTGDE